MKKLLLMLLLVICFNAKHASAQPSFGWASSLNGSNFATGTVKMAEDKNGGFYTTGSFEGTKSFGSFTRTAQGAFDVFIAKYDNSGNCLWINQYGNTSLASYCNSNGITVDANGDVIIFGTYSDTIIIGNNTLVSYGSGDMFFVKINSSGAVLFSQRCGGTSEDRATSIVTDSQNNFYLGGSFRWKAYFGTDSVGNNILSSDIFIAKYNSSGQIQWIKSAGGLQDDECSALSVANDNIFITGTISGACNFGGFILSPQNSDGYIVKYSNTGNCLWAKKFGGPQNDYSQYVGTDVQGNSFVTGAFIQTATFGNGKSVTTGNFEQIFIAKYDSNGICQWVNKGGNPSVGNYTGTVSTDLNGSSIIVGSFSGTASFGTKSVTSFGQVDACIVKYDSQGVCQYALKCGGNNSDYGLSALYLTKTNEFLVSGNYQNSATFGSLSLTTPPGSTNANFITKLSNTFTGIESFEALYGGQVYPNPVIDLLNIDLSNNTHKAVSVKLHNLLGAVVIAANIEEETNVRLDLRGLVPAIYFVKIQNSDGSCLIKKVVKK